MSVHIWDLALDTVMGKIGIETVCKQQINIRMKVFEWRHYGVLNHPVSIDTMSVRAVIVILQEFVIIHCLYSSVNKRM